MLLHWNRHLPPQVLTDLLTITVSESYKQEIRRPTLNERYFLRTNERYFLRITQHIKVPSNVNDKLLSHFKKKGETL